MPISYLPFEQRKCGLVPRGLVYSVPPFIIFNAKHTGAGFPLTGNSGLKYRHVPHIFSGFDCPGQLLFPIVAPFPFVLCPAFIPWVPFRHFDPVYFYFGTGEHLAEKFRHCSHLLWDVERLRLLMLRANPPNRAIVAILIPHNLARLIGFFEPVPIVPPCGRFGEILHCFNCDFRQYVIRGIVKMRLQRITVDNLGNLFQKFFSFVHRFIDF